MCDCIQNAYKALNALPGTIHMATDRNGDFGIEVTILPVNPKDIISDDLSEPKLGFKNLTSDGMRFKGFCEMRGASKNPTKIHPIFFHIDFNFCPLCGQKYTNQD